MRALVARRLDGPDAIELIDTPVPVPGPGHVRIAVAAAAVNPVDVAVASGALVQIGLTAPREQFGLGWDVAGTVDAVGPGVDLQIGTAVVGLADLLGRPLKTHAEQVVLDATAVAPAPRGLDPVAASTIPLNALTADQALDLLALPPGATLLVTGAAGAVGGFAVQLARHLGLDVIAVAAPADEPLVRELGARHVVPRGADLPTAVRELVPGGVDGVVDAALVGIAAQETVRNGGAFAHLVATPPPAPLRGIRVHTVLVSADCDRLRRLACLAEVGVISARVAGVHALDEAPAAYRKVAGGGLRGRMVLIP
ncbi:NADPH:quinone reductase-like Zn-dependent oxidoreductase [Pseudonocardia hierapolitana]|uniref:NADPH:quinone reductase-like Zn-dependent oxidoreductase n=1 Tax=Pseudonocardia hierapolitana TaxID=1128676 RepID=A0A561SRT2_9PSEU|nr:NADP-dependent oxidoreductase [Pseudonocardia hierapolitana]TWF77578.1 NADPH:quinone reductase-like Zn-dependent oxidoreductase [Pseudonocardia hierapolitana]